MNWQQEHKKNVEWYYDVRKMHEEIVNCFTGDFREIDPEDDILDADEVMELQAFGVIA